MTKDDERRLCEQCRWMRFCESSQLGQHTHIHQYLTKTKLDFFINSLWLTVEQVKTTDDEDQFNQSSNQMRTNTICLKTNTTIDWLAAREEETNG